jgi:hypothetical protein
MACLRHLSRSIIEARRFSVALSDKTAALGFLVRCGWSHQLLVPRFGRAYCHRTEFWFTARSDDYSSDASNIPVCLFGVPRARGEARFRLGGCGDAAWRMAHSRTIHDPRRDGFWWRLCRTGRSSGGLLLTVLCIFPPITLMFATYDGGGLALLAVTIGGLLFWAVQSGEIRPLFRRSPK